MPTPLSCRLWQQFQDSTFPVSKGTSHLQMHLPLWLRRRLQKKRETIRKGPWLSLFRPPGSSFLQLGRAFKWTLLFRSLQQDVSDNKNELLSFYLWTAHFSPNTCAQTQRKSTYAIPLVCQQPFTSMCCTTYQVEELGGGTGQDGHQLFCGLNVWEIPKKCCIPFISEKAVYTSKQTTPL